MVSRAVIKSSSSRDVIKSRTLRLALALRCPLQAPDADLKSRPLALHYRPSWEFVFMEACCGDHHTEQTRFSFSNLLHLHRPLLYFIEDITRIEFKVPPTAELIKSVENVVIQVSKPITPNVLSVLIHTTMLEC